MRKLLWIPLVMILPIWLMLIPFVIVFKNSYDLLLLVMKLLIQEIRNSEKSPTL